MLCTSPPPNHKAWAAALCYVFANCPAAYKQGRRCKGQSKHYHRPMVSVASPDLSPCTTEVSGKACTAGCWETLGHLRKVLAPLIQPLLFCSSLGLCWPFEWPRLLADFLYNALWQIFEGGGNIGGHTFPIQNTGKMEKVSLSLSLSHSR